MPRTSPANLRPPRELAVLVRARRARDGLTQEALAGLAGMPRSTLGRIEAGRPALLESYERLTGPLGLPEHWYGVRATLRDELDDASVTAALVAQERPDRDVLDLIEALVLLGRTAQGRSEASRLSRDLLRRMRPRPGPPSSAPHRAGR